MDNNILFVDDEALILSAIRRAVRGEKFTPFFANSGDEALHIMAQHEIKVLVTDMRMPGMNGLELLKLVKANYPDTIKIVLSGYTQVAQIMATINQGDIFRFITKPWDSSEDLIATVLQGLEYYNILKKQADLEKNLEQKNKSYQNILKMMNDKLDYVNKNIKDMRIINKAIFDNAVDDFSCQGTEGPRVYQMKFFRDIQELYLDTMLIPPKLFTLENYIRALQQSLDHTFNITLEGKVDGKQWSWGGNLKFIVGVVKLFATKGDQEMLNENQDITITLVVKEEGLVTSIRWSDLSPLSPWLTKIAPLLGFIENLLQQSGMLVNFSYGDDSKNSIEMTLTSV